LFPRERLKLRAVCPRHPIAGRFILRVALVLHIVLAAVLNAEPPEKTRVFLAGTEPERISGEAVTGQSRSMLELTRSAPSLDIEAMRTFSRECPGVVMTTRRDKADIIIRIEREGPNPTTPFVKGNRIAVFNLDDELVYATRARLLRNASRDACRAIRNSLRSGRTQ
jgi:hypothetical protein